jgi:hypothetical protein
MKNDFISYLEHFLVASVLVVGNCADWFESIKSSTTAVTQREINKPLYHPAA